MFPENDGVVYKLPEISDENGKENVTITVDGLDETCSAFDLEALQIRFFNLSVSKNVSAEIKLEDLDGNSNLYDIKFIFKINEIITDSNDKPSNNISTSTFEGVNVDKVDREREEKMRQKAEEVVEVEKFTCEIKSMTSEA